jgi:hypothetical protein
MSNRTRLIAALGMAGMAALAGQALAHHSYAMFDRNKTTSITGAIRNFEMVNPHSYVWVTVPTASGTQIWGLEGGGVAAMQRAGLTKASVKTGETVTIDLHPLRDGRTGGQLVRIKLADGKIIGAPLEPEGR